MGNFYKYAELVTLNRRPEILAVKEVVATEKLHGTNFRVYFPAGMKSIDEVEYGGRNETFGTGGEGGGGDKFYGGKPVRWWKERPQLLTTIAAVLAGRGLHDVVIYGEMCASFIQRGVRYGAPGEVLFRAFDLRIGENLASYDLFCAICDEVGLPRVPEVWRGEPSLAAFDALLERPSDEGQRNGVTEANNLAEGVVIRSRPLLRNVFGEWLIIKHKAERFAEVVKEKSRGEKQAEEGDRSAIADFVKSCVVPGRVTNALGRLRDTGAALKGDMSDMALLVPAIYADLQKECAPELAALFAAGSTEKQVRGQVAKVLGVVYRRMLMEEVAL